MTSHRLYAIAGVLIVAIFAIVSAACGGGDDNDNNQPANATATQTPASAAETPVTGIITPPANEATATPAPGQGGGNETNAATVQVTEKDFDIDLGQDSAQTGKTTFNIKNNGPSTHEFVVFKTDLPADKLPMESDESEVDEDAASVTHIDEVEDIAAGTTEKLTVDLQPGQYVLICNIPGHYQLGMHTAFTVK